MKTITYVLVLMVAIDVCAETNFKQLFDADLPRKALKISYQENGEINEILVSSWIDRVKTEKGLQYHKFEQGFSYVRKEGFIKIFDDDGKLLNQVWNKNIDGGVAKEEVLKAFELFKGNDIVKKHFAETKLELIIYGGFNYEDDKECQLGMRCVHVFASTIDVGILAHSIIRLTDAKVVYPDFDREPKIALKKTKYINQ